MQRETFTIAPAYPPRVLAASSTVAIDRSWQSPLQAEVRPLGRLQTVELGGESPDRLQGSLSMGQRKSLMHRARDTIAKRIRDCLEASSCVEVHEQQHGGADLEAVARCEWEAHRPGDRPPVEHGRVASVLVGDEDSASLDIDSHRAASDARIAPEVHREAGMVGVYATYGVAAGALREREPAARFRPGFHVEPVPRLPHTPSSALAPTNYARHDSQLENVARGDDISSPSSHCLLTRSVRLSTR